ncbi:MAG: low affinity iron permease family protein [Gemmataceae bacterium]
MSSRRGGLFEVFARKATEWTGSSWAFALAILTIIAWVCTYPLFSNFDTWQLVINTGTTIVTFLMVFLIQRSQNKDSQALHLKLNELVAAIEGASNRLINIEDMSEDEVRALHCHFAQLVQLAKEDQEICQSHSVEEASERAKAKRRKRETSTLSEPEA